MTAIVGILNKRAVCVAADSAVTFGNGFKIHNSANKIFPVGEKHPVGIMIYGNACFIKTPWEIIIKMYGKYIENDQKSCLESYAQDFIHFLYQNHFFMDEQNIDSYLQYFLYHIHGCIKDEAKSTKKTLVEIYESYYNVFKEGSKYEELINLSFDDFLKLTNHTINVIKSEITISEEGNVEESLLIEKTFYEIIKTKDNIFQCSGIVFVGYGKSDIYPKLMSYKISFPIKHKLRYFCDNHTDINNHGNDASITPFAQTDVIETIISGIDRPLLQEFLTYSKETLEQMHRSIISELLIEKDNVPPNIENFNLEKFSTELSNRITLHIEKTQVAPLLQSIGALEKSELAEVAESLIALTSVKRKITFYTESAGGPIDVAIISKHEGFQWIKKK